MGIQGSKGGLDNLPPPDSSQDFIHLCFIEGKGGAK